MAGRPWTAEEDAIVRENWRYGAAKRLARRLGRTPAAVSQRAGALGCRLYEKGNYAADLLDFIRAGNQAGKLDRDITDAWNEAHPDRTITRRSLSYLRKDVLGLEVPADALLERKRAAYRSQCETLRIDGVPDLARRKRRRQARQAGWPEHCSPMQLSILDYLADGEYRTREEIAAEIGQRGPQRAWFKCRLGSRSSLDNLVKDGLVARTKKRTRKGAGKGYSKYEYYIPLEVLTRHRQWANKRRIA